MPPTIAAGAPVWTSLETAKLVVDAFVPITVVWLGLWVHRATKRIEASHWVNQKLIEHKLNVYNDISPPLNDIYCYIAYIGDFKNMTPPDVVAKKRLVDRKFHLAKRFFSSKFRSCYADFIFACFKEYTGINKDAEIRTGKTSRKTNFGSKWAADWDKLFVSDRADKTDIVLVRQKYDALMEQFIAELSLKSNLQDPRISLSIGG